jgi:hypothetical protein
MTASVEQGANLSEGAKLAAGIVGIQRANTLTEGDGK